MLSLHARGIKHVVAPLGTAFTAEQASQIRRFTQNVTLLFDPDEAGRRAVRSARDTCVAARLTAKVATLPAGIDPDELARRGGPEQANRVIGGARAIVEHLIDELFDDYRELPSTTTAQAARVKAAIELVASEPDPTARSLAEQYALRRLAANLRLGDGEGRTLATIFRQVTTAAGTGPPSAVAAGARVQPPTGLARGTGVEEVGLEILGALPRFFALSFSRLRRRRKRPRCSRATWRPGLPRCVRPARRGSPTLK